MSCGTINNDCNGVHVQNVGEMELCEMIIGENILKALTEDIIQSDIEIKEPETVIHSAL